MDKKVMNVMKIEVVYNHMVTKINPQATPSQTESSIIYFSNKVYLTPKCAATIFKPLKSLGILFKFWNTSMEADPATIGKNMDEYFRDNVTSWTDEDLGDEICRPVTDGGGDDEYEYRTAEETKEESVR